MRPKYVTRAIVLARTSHGEANSLVTLLAEEFGLIRTRAQGVRKSGAKLAPALRTLSELDASILYGKEGWRLNGASQTEDHFSGLSSSARARAGRLSLLLLRLAPGEEKEAELFHAFRDFLNALKEGDDATHDEAECLAALRIVNALGLDAGEIPSEVGENRRAIIARINKGITASGL